MSRLRMMMALVLCMSGMLAPAHAEPAREVPSHNREQATPGAGPRWPEQLINTNRGALKLSYRAYSVRYLGLFGTIGWTLETLLGADADQPETVLFVYDPRELAKHDYAAEIGRWIAKVDRSDSFSISIIPRKDFADLVDSWDAALPVKVVQANQVTMDTPWNPAVLTDLFRSAIEAADNDYLIATDVRLPTEHVEGELLTDE